MPADTNVLCDGVYTKEHYTYQESHKDLFYPEAPKSVYSSDKPQKEKREHWFTASDESVQEPINTQKEAKYPYNHILETESGHYVEFDDTAGNERIQIHHRTGSFVEINPEGHITVKGIGNVTNIVDGNLDTIVHGNYSLTVEGTMDVFSYGKNIKLLVKPHPNCPIISSDYPGLEMEITMESISTLLLKSNIAFTSNVTSAAVDSYCAGANVVTILDPSTFNLSPLKDFEGVSFVSTPEELATVLNRVYQRKNVEGQGDNYFFLDSDLPRWNELLISSN